MALSLILAGLGVLWVALAVRHGGWAWLYLWPGVSFLVVALAYARSSARYLGKRSDGTIAPWALVLLLPYFLLAWLTWVVYAWVRRADRANEVAPGLWVGRRSRASRLPPDVGLVVDMTSEFWAPACVRNAAAGKGPRPHAYVCLPTLDNGAPDEAALRAVVERVAASDRPVYVHCAQGYGRSAMVAAAVLIRKGAARDVDDAVALLKKARPNVRLSAAQRRIVSRVSSPTAGDGEAGSV